MRLSYYTILILLFTCFTISCKKEKFVDAKDAQIELSSYLLDFDTVFTSKNSITNKVKIKNQSSKKLLIQRISLAEDMSEIFHLNINGVDTNRRENIIIDKGDSIYLFVNLTIPPSQKKDPFLIEDKIVLVYGGQETFIELKAWARNARELKDYTVTTHEVWDADLPYLIQGKLTINTGATLTLQKGTSIYLHADAGIIVKGSLKANGTVTEPVVLRNDRLDKGYANLSGSWPGLQFETTSNNNQLYHTQIKNARNGISILGSTQQVGQQLLLDGCVIENISGFGIIANNSSVQANNCLIAHCGLNVNLLNGGNYNFTHCTIVTYNNKYLFKSGQLLKCSNFSNDNGLTTAHPFRASFINCIIWGDGNNILERIVATKSDAALFSLSLQNSLYEFVKNNGLFDIQNCITDQNPAFELTDGNRHLFNFKLQATSPALGLGQPTAITEDIDGNTRSAFNPDAGCYEYQ